MKTYKETIEDGYLYNCFQGLSLQTKWHKVKKQPLLTSPVSDIRQILLISSAHKCFTLSLFPGFLSSPNSRNAQWRFALACGLAE